MSKLGFEKDDLLPLAGLKECPVRITLHTDLQTEMIKKTARADPDSIPPIDVAELADEKALVIVDGHQRVEAVKSFGIDKGKTPQCTKHDRGSNFACKAEFEKPDQSSKIL